MKHFILFCFFPLLGYQLCFFFLFFSDCLRVCNIHLQLIQVHSQITLYHFISSMSTYNNKKCWFLPLLLAFLLSFISLVHKCAWIYIILWTVVLEKTLETLESPWDCKEIQPVHSEGDQPWDFFGRNDAQAETPVLWPPHAKGWLIGKDSDAGRDWGQEEKGTTEDEMAGWRHQLDGHESEWTPGVGDGQEGLVCCDSWGRKESDTTEWLIWSDMFPQKKYGVLGSMCKVNVREIFLM